MEGHSSSASGQASRLSALLASGLDDFLDPNDKHIFNVERPLSEVDSQGDPISPSEKQTALEIDILNRELMRCPLDDPGSIRCRIEELNKMSISLKKELTIIAESRHGEIMEVSKSLMTSSSMRSICEDYYPKLKAVFNGYARSSLQNVMQLPKIRSKKASLKHLIGMLDHLGKIGKCCDIIRSYHHCTRHRIVAGAVALHTIESVVEKYPEASRLLLLRSIRNTISNRIKTLVKNASIKLGSGVNFRETIQLLHLLGIEPEYAASYMLHDYRRHISGTLLSTLQRYCNLDRYSWKTGTSQCHISGQYEKTSPSTATPLEQYTRLLGPDMIILTLCKVLSDFITFFEYAASDLSREASTVVVPFDSTTLPASLYIIQNHINQLDTRTLGAYMDLVLSIIRSNFDSLRAYACGLLATVIGEMNVHGVKDKIDYLKICLLLRFFIISCNECIIQGEGMPTAENEDSESTCIIDDSPDSARRYGRELHGIRRILKGYVDVLIQVLPKDDHGYTKKDAYQQLENLEEVVQTRLMAFYMEHFYQQSIEELSSSLKRDSSERQAVPVGDVYESCDVFALCKMFKSRIKESIRLIGGIKICSLNPYNGWTPNSAFLGFNIEQWPTPPQYCGFSARERGQSLMKQSDAPLEAGSVLMESIENIDGHCGLSQDEWAYMYRNYGCVFTSTSFTFWSQLRLLFRILVVQPNAASSYVKRMLGAFDWLLLRIIRICQMSPNIDDLQNLRDFVHSQNHLTADDIIPPEKCGNISMLAKVVNRVESTSTLLELLRCRLQFTCERCTSVVKDHYNARIAVLKELRAGVYPLCMLSLLQKRLPGEQLLQLLQLNYVTIPQACRDTEELMVGLIKHLYNVKEFIEGADCGSIPMPVKVMLWRYTCLVLRSTMRAMYDSLEKVNVSSQILAVVNTNYQKALEHCGSIYDAYQREAGREARRHWHAVRHLAVYETMMYELIKP